MSAREVDYDWSRVHHVEVRGLDRPKGTFTPSEVAERGLQDVPVIAPGQVVIDGRKVAVAGDVLSWADAVRFGLVGP